MPSRDLLWTNEERCHWGSGTAILNAYCILSYILVTSALWANTWTFLKKSTLFFDITSLPIFSLCLPHLHNVIRDIFLSEIDETQKKILGLEVLGFDAILQYIAGNREIREKNNNR